MAVETETLGRSENLVFDDNLEDDEDLNQWLAYYTFIRTFQKRTPKICFLRTVKHQQMCHFRLMPAGPNFIFSLTQWVMNDWVIDLITNWLNERISDSANELCFYYAGLLQLPYYYSPFGTNTVTLNNYWGQEHSEF